MMGIMTSSSDQDDEEAGSFSTLKASLTNGMHNIIMIKC